MLKTKAIVLAIGLIHSLSTRDTEKGSTKDLEKETLRRDDAYVRQEDEAKNSTDFSKTLS